MMPAITPSITASTFTGLVQPATPTRTRICTTDYAICTHARTHARTRLTALCPGLTNLDFTKARDSEWQWHQLGHMQVCTSFQTDNHARTPPLSFLQAGCPSCRPTNSVKALKAVRLCYTVNKISKSTPIYSARICLLYTISIYLPSVL